MKKPLIALFIAAFALNWVWEVLHSNLYVHYHGGPITNLVLLKATLVDAIIIVALVLLARGFRLPPYWTLVLGGLVVAIGIEWWALSTARWAYGPYMPILPILRTGFTPTIQLAISGCIATRIVLGKKLR